MTHGKYIDRGGEQVYMPPFDAKNVDFFGFVLPADTAAMQRSICDRCLNGPMGRPGAYEIAMPAAMLVFNNLASLTSTTPPFDMRGHFPEHEMAFWTLVLDRERERLFWFHPYILVDNAYALSMGREIYGFPKGLGRFEIPADHTSVEHLSAETIVVPTFGPQAQALWRCLVDVRHTGTGPALPRMVDGLKLLASTIHRILSDTPGLKGDIKLAEHELADLWDRNIDMVFLKQFRDAQHSDEAVYQAIVETACRMTQLNGVALYDSTFSVEIGDFDSHPIRADLGLAAGPLQPVAAFWTGFDFWIGEGTAVWSAGP